MAAKQVARKRNSVSSGSAMGSLAVGVAVEIISVGSTLEVP